MNADPLLPRPDRLATARATNAGRDEPAVLCELASLLETAARLPLDDVVAVDQLRHRAHEITSRLALTGHMPHRLVVAPDDPDVVVLRALAAARARTAPGGASPVITESH